MIWIIFLGMACFIGGYITCGLLTHYKDDRIRELENALFAIIDAESKIREEALQIVKQELHERVRSKSTKTN